MAEPSREFSGHELPTAVYESLMGTQTNSFMGHLARWASDKGSSKEFLDVERIRASFASAGEATSEATVQPVLDLPDFTVQKELGQGSFGVVYKARDEKLMRDVALKVLLPNVDLEPGVRESFLNEARILARIRHPNVLTIYAVQSQEERIALVMEFIAGEPERMTVAERDTLAARELTGVRLSCQILCDQDMSVRAISRLEGSGRPDAGGKPTPEIQPQPVEWVGE